MENTPRSANEWTLLVYRVPASPTKLRVQVWRRLRKMGALYLENAVWAVPSRPDLVENMTYVAGMVEEMGGSCHLFAATALLPGGSERLADEFRALADERLEPISERLDRIAARLEEAASPSALERAEEEMKRERVAALRARRLAYFGSAREAEADAKLEALRSALDDQYRESK